MQKFVVRNAGQVGVIKDTPAHAMPPNAWSTGKNVRFRENAAEKITGESSVFGTPLGPPWYLQETVVAGIQTFWIYPGQNDIFSTDGTNHATISSVSAGYSATLDLNWTSATLPGGVYVFNNGVDRPQQWTGTSFSDKVADLSNWPSGMTARTLRPFKNFLVAANINEGAGRIPQLLRWSNEADPGAVPGSWDYTDPTVNTGRTTIGNRAGEILDMLPLRDYNVIYRDDEIWLMQFVGGNAIFAFRQAFTQIGTLGRRCAADVRGRHFVFSFDDLVMHDAQTAQSIANHRIRRNIFSSIDSTNFERSFVVPNYANNEIWFCYPTNGASVPTEAWIWSWQDDTWYKRELPGVAHISFGEVTSATDTFDGGSSGSFDTDMDNFDAGSLAGAENRLLMAGTDDTLLYRGDNTEQFNGTNFTAQLIRLALPLGRDGRLDLDHVKYVREIIPYVTGTTGGVLRVYVSGRNSLDDSEDWEGPFNYVIGTDRKIDCRVSGRVIDVRFESTTNITWRLSGYSVEYRIGGQR